MCQLSLTAPVTPSFPPLSYQDVPVLTTGMLAQAYEVEARRIRQNFANNRERFVEGKHFFILSGNDLRAFKNSVENFDSVRIAKNVNALTLWTERGAARNAKMLDSDRAWDVFELLEETFFRVVRPASPTPDDFTGPLSITPEQQCTLQEIVRAKVEVFPKNQRPSLYAQAWSRFNTHFRLAKYCQLQREKMSEGITYLTRMELAVPVSSINPAPAPATVLPAAPSSPADDAEGHLAAIREHIRQIHRHEESLFLLARKALPAVRKPGDMFSPALRTGLTALQSLEDCAGALDYSLRALESAARTMLALGQ